MSCLNGLVSPQVTEPTLNDKIIDDAVTVAIGLGGQRLGRPRGLSRGKCHFPGRNPLLLT